MSILKLSENITRLRKEKKLTQDELADFMGVTKASVSKWETEQCMPDIMLLPRLASFFDVTIDELMGYDPQLTPEQIKRIYLDFTLEFTSKPCDEVFNKVRDTIKRYYSCYPLLLQICILYLNHASLAMDIEKVYDLLKEARELCVHIINSCDNVSINSDAISLKAVFDLQLGDSDDVIDQLEPILDTSRISTQNASILIQAYCASGLKDKAISFTQISMYLNIISLVGLSIQNLSININNKEVTYETIKRIDELSCTYDLNNLHPNIMGQFNYQSAINYIVLGDVERAIDKLNKYSDNLDTLLDDDCRLHGDKYFNQLDTYINALTLGSNPPRDKSFVRKNALMALENPIFKAIENNEEFILIKKRIGEK